MLLSDCYCVRFIESTWLLDEHSRMVHMIILSEHILVTLDVAELHQDPGSPGVPGPTHPALLRAWPMGADWGDRNASASTSAPGPAVTDWEFAKQEVSQDKLIFCESTWDIYWDIWEWPKNNCQGFSGRKTIRMAKVWCVLKNFAMNTKTLISRPVIWHPNSLEFIHYWWRWFCDIGHM